METLQKLGRSQRSGLYTFVHRGPVAWASHDWDKHPNSMAIMMDQTGVFPQRRRGSPQGLTEAQISIEIAARLPMNSEELDDTLMDRLFEDVVEMLLRLEKSSDDKGLPVVFDIIGERVTAIEFSDVTRGVQGIVVNFPILY